TSGDEDEKDFNSGTLTKETWQAPWAEGGARQNSVERTPSSGGHQPIGKRLSPAVANFMCRFRGSKSQSDLDADCEDNTADYDSASMMSASEALAPNSSQFFVPAASGEGDFRTHVQEIRVAGMQQLGQSGGQATDEDPLSDSSSSSDEQDDPNARPDAGKQRTKVFLMQQIGQQETRISQLERAIDDLSKQLYDAHRQNTALRSENEALASKFKSDGC
uniref:Uncharacterized protein n=1 Tax=Plectus sambesii TaxID=2011161 RepID=A0A914UYI6_9BILA